MPIQGNSKALSMFVIHYPARGIPISLNVHYETAKNFNFLHEVEKLLYLFTKEL
jgi:hypothetical protein